LLINIFNLQPFFLTGCVSWTWAESNGAICRDACAESRPPKGGAIVHGQLCSALRGMFVQSFYFVSYYFLELNMMILKKKFRRPIIAGWRRDMGTILRPIWILIRTCGWRWDRLADPKQIGSTGSPTLWPKTCDRSVVSQPLGALHQYRAPSLRSLWPWSNNMNDSR